MKIKPFFILAALFSSCSLAAVAQITPPAVNTDTTGVEAQKVIIEKDDNDEVQEIESYSDKFVPRKASLYSAILPGAGQVYNKKYWKVPIIYGGFIALGFTVDFYNNNYTLLRSELFKSLQDEDYQSPYGDADRLRDNINRERRDRDFYMIMIGLLYFLQIADAHIDAHLKEFDLNPDLQVSIEPSFENSAMMGRSTGLSIKFKF